MRKISKKSKQYIIDKNEHEFGKEIREKYGDEIIDASNMKIKNMNEEKLECINTLTIEVLQSLSDAFKDGNPQGELAFKTCELHKKWLCMFWNENMYSPQAHLALVKSYLDDERFINYYDKIEKGCTQFLYEAMKFYCHSFHIE